MTPKIVFILFHQRTISHELSRCPIKKCLVINNSISEVCCVKCNTLKNIMEIIVITFVNIQFCTFQLELLLITHDITI